MGEEEEEGKKEEEEDKEEEEENEEEEDKEWKYLMKLEASSPVASGEKILLVMSMKCSGLTQPKDKKKHIDDMLTPLICVPFTVVGLQCIVGCIMYNKQVVWP